MELYPVRAAHGADSGGVGAPGQRLKAESFDAMVIQETADPEVVIVDYQARGRITTTGKAYQQSINAVFRVRDGKIVLSRDYLDPLALAEARTELSTPVERGAG
ncbi:hypothetical protein ND748_17425 [Frankia sp. AiPs1]|uniref:nuclear transport factor 2 family protein n=1 Tax=Frankia sp. AiPs1 TaxID=573493 RepID=UPI00204495CB|nr:limonene-1,2-epoxide hydrolase family protein [Frankia sp. AiPs1]MCM3923434.1 hypothetical protein [Frankia sp. AiPs1]